MNRADGHLVKRKSRSGRRRFQIRSFFFVFIIQLLSVCTFHLFANTIISNPELHIMYYKMLFLPVSAFVSCFFGYLFTKNFLAVSACCYAVHVGAYFLFVSFSFFGLLWGLLYYFNGLLGFLIAFFACAYSD